MFPRAKKSFGQNFLNDASVVEDIILAAEITPGETVLEIGPGTGVLTHALVDAGAKVVAVEADHDLVGPLREEFGSAITLIEGDVLRPETKHEWKKHLTESYKLIANIPYNITSAIIEEFLRDEPNCTRLVLMVQREVADRLTAAPGEMGVLSVAAQVYAEARRVRVVPRGAFRPVPRVDSAVVSLARRAQPLVDDPEKLIALAKAGFSSPRKQMHGNLAHAGYGTNGEMKAAMESCGLNPLARAETLSLQQWIALSQAIAQA